MIDGVRVVATAAMHLTAGIRLFAAFCMTRPTGLDLIVEFVSGGEFTGKVGIQEFDGLAGGIGTEASASFFLLIAERLAA